LIISSAQMKIALTLTVSLLLILLAACGPGAKAKEESSEASQVQLERISQENEALHRSLTVATNRIKELDGQPDQFQVSVLSVIDGGLFCIIDGFVFGRPGLGEVDFSLFSCSSRGDGGRNGLRSEDRPGPSAVCRLQSALGLRPRRALSSAEAKRLVVHGGGRHFPFPFPLGSIGRETGNGSLSW
jgi:hypothetical protein